MRYFDTEKVEEIKGMIATLHKAREMMWTTFGRAAQKYNITTDEKGLDLGINLQVTYSLEDKLRELIGEEPIRCVRR